MSTDTEMGKYRKLSSNYFVLVNPIIIFLVAVGMYLITMAWLSPDKIPTSLFGPAADLAIKLGKDFPNFTRQFVLCVYAIHFAEAAVCLYVCHQLKLNLPTTIAWFLQTLGLGMFALRFLIWP
ncbi:unnamed protein product, partial [Meganyctiphanes norvegica]